MAVNMSNRIWGIYPIFEWTWMRKLLLHNAQENTIRQRYLYCCTRKAKVSKSLRRVISSRDFSTVWVFVVVFLWVPGLCGCTYQAKLFNGEPFKPGTGVAVVCKINEKPMVEVSESGDFWFWAAGGPGPIAAGAAYIVNESNNRQHEEKLQTVINKNGYCDKLTEELKRVLEESGFQVKEIQKVYKNVGDVITLGLLGAGSDKVEDRHTLEYILVLNTKYGLFDSEAQCSAEIEGRLIRVTDKKTVWKNKLSFEGRTGGKHKGFGDGKEAIKKWQNDPVGLEAGIEEAIKGVCRLLEREFSGCIEDDEPLEKLEIRPGGWVKAKIIEQSPERIVLRLLGGSIRSIPAEELVREEEEVALSE
jgi:hypothetical protein